MKRKIITIDEKKCNGCGLCVDACHEGAIELIDGKAKLISESYCDGLGDCLPECPTGAITLEERETVFYDKETVEKRMSESKTENTCSCPGIAEQVITKTSVHESKPVERNESKLQQWPCQIKLVPPNASFLNNSHILIAADCTAYAYANIHEDFMKGRITLIGCPKLDNIDYSEKLTEILRLNNIKSILIIRMQVPCCGGIVNSVQNALLNSGKMIPCNVVTVGVEGNIVEDF